MKKSSFEKLDDSFVNLYEEALFVRCFEYSAILLWELTGYRVFVNIDKKTWFLFLELWFPKTKLNEIIANLESKWYFLRIMLKNWELNSTIWSIEFERDKEKIIKYKNDLIKFE